LALTAEGVVGLFERDAGARKRLAELLVSEPDVRLAIINAVLRDVATKADLEALGRALREEMRELKADLLAEMDRRSGDFDKRFEMFDKRLGDFNERFEMFDKRLGDFNERFEMFDKRLGDFDKRFGDFDKRFEMFDKRLGDFNERFEMFDKRLGDFDKRLGDLHKGLDVTNERISDLNRIVAASFVGIVATLVATILLRFLP